MPPTKEQIRVAYERMIARCEERLVVPELGPCLVFTGAVNTNGYAAIRVGHSTIGGHRLAWLANNGTPPRHRPYVLHHCDNQPCVRLAHLHAGTHGQNMEEARLRRRFLAGGSGTSAKISDAQAEEIRLRYLTEDVLQRELGDQYGIDQSNVSRIIARRTFAA